MNAAGLAEVIQGGQYWLARILALVVSVVIDLR
jgi:hypothetical protein